MGSIKIPDSLSFDFALQLVQSVAPLLPDRYDIQWHTQQLEIHTDHPILGRLLQRIAEKRPAIFPYIKRTRQKDSQRDTHFWLIMGPTRREIEQMLTRVSKFVIPSYAEFVDKNRVPICQPFKTNGNTLEQLGSMLYPAGYYSWRSRSSDFHIVLQRLELWMNLEEAYPSFSTAQRQTYRDWYGAFQTALATAQWQDAEKCIQEMRYLHLATAENLAFLQVQLLAQQQRWLDIWQRADFADLARLRMPNAVRAALLTAFHASVLYPLEKQNRWQDAFDAFCEHHPTLGQLLTGRFGLTQPSVLQVYAYQAAFEKDKDDLTHLSTLADEEEVRECIAHLQQLIIGNETVEEAALPTIIHSPLELAGLACNNRDYDKALALSREIPDGSERAIMLMQIAFHAGEVSLADEALTSFGELSQELQHILVGKNPYLLRYLPYLQELTQRTQLSSVSIHNWLEWFRLADTDPYHSELDASLERLDATSEQYFQNKDMVKSLNEPLLTFIVDDRFSTHKYTKAILQKLTEFFLKDANFPRDDDAYRELYETLYDGLLGRQEVNLHTGLAILRLAGAMLRQAPVRCQRIAKECMEWCERPIPALEQWALDAFDLFAEYGLMPGLLIPWYREWVTHLLDLPGARERTHLEAWQLFGQWIQPGNDVLTKLQGSLTLVIEQKTDDPLAALPSGYRIGIFSLSESPALYAKRLLLARNAALDVRLCHEKDLNDQAKALAQNADLVVIVTTSIKHALSLGIRPYLKTDPVYPQSDGSTSIVRALEQRIQTLKLLG